MLTAANRRRERGHRHLKSAVLLSVFFGVAVWHGETPADKGVQVDARPAPLTEELLQSKPFLLDSQGKVFGITNGDAAVLGFVAQVSADNRSVVVAAYEDALSRVDEAVEAWIVRRSKVPDFDQSQDLILASRRLAVEAYFDADYSEALRLIRQALAEVEQVFVKEQEYFDINLKIAISAYETEDVQRAQDAIAFALALRPSSEEATYWQQQIDRLPALVAARQDALAARNADHPHDEIIALQRVLKIRPDDVQAEARIESVFRLLQEREFNRSVKAGYRALEDKDIPKANEALSQAKKLRPTHAEIARLSGKIAQVERGIKVAELLTEAEQNALEDDWNSARQALDQILQLDPNINDAIKGREFAERMILAQRNLDDFLARPERLSSQNIVTAARRELERAQPLVEFSPHMQSTVTELKSEISKWQESIPVRVLSDGYTHIEVRGVGIVGVVTDRLVMLKPGAYQFEGERKGYRNKLVNVKVSPSQSEIIEVTIICDEQT